MVSTVGTVEQIQQIQQSQQTAAIMLLSSHVDQVQSLFPRNTPEWNKLNNIVAKLDQLASDLAQPEEA